MPAWVETRNHAVHRFETAVHLRVHNIGHILLLDDNEKPVAIFPADAVLRAQKEDPAKTDG